MKLAKTILVGSMLFAPALAMGIAQQDPAIPAQPQQQNLQQDLQQDKAPMAQDVVGTIVEVREDSFSVRKDADQSVVWFSITPELKSSASAELVTGNHVRVSAMPGDSPDRWSASSVMAEVSAAPADTSAQADLDTDTDLDVDIDEDSATATIDRDTTVEDNDTLIAQDDTTSDLREDTDYDADEADELPSTATSLPEIAVFGLLALIGAAAVAFARKF